MKKRILILSLLFIVFVIALTPAKAIFWIMPVQKNIVISGVSGKIWSANIEQVNYQQMQLEKVKVSPGLFSLISLQPEFAFDILKGDLTGTGNLALQSASANGFLMSDANIQINAAYLQTYLPLRQLKLNGIIKTSQLTLQTEKGKLILADGKLSWLQSVVEYSGNSWALGDFILKLETNKQNKTVSGELQKTNNQLGLQGKLTLNQQGVFEFIGSVSTDIDQSLFNALSLFANGKVENSRLPIKYKQRLF